MYHVACIMYTIARGLQGAKCECKARPAAVVVRRTTYFHASFTPPHAPSQLSSHTPSAPPPPPGLSLPLSLAPTRCSAATLLCYTPTPSSIPHHDATATATATACLPRPLPPRPMSCPSLLPQSSPELPLAPSPYIASTLPRPSSAPVPFGSTIPRASRAWLISSFLHPSIPTLKDGRTEGTRSSLNKFTSPAVLQVQSSGQIDSIRSGLASHRDLLAGFECWYPLFLSVSKSSSHNRFTSPFMLLSESMALLVVVLGSLFVNYTNSASKPSLVRWIIASSGPPSIMRRSNGRKQ